MCYLEKLPSPKYCIPFGFCCERLTDAGGTQSALETTSDRLNQERRFESHLAIVEENALHLQTIESLEDAIVQSGVPEEKMLGNAETILFVEDEAFVRDVTCEVLQSAGYQVLPAKNAVEATHLYDQHSGDVKLLLSDVVLPGETGRALARKLRKENPFLKILLVTGYAEKMGLQAEKPEEFLAKPFSAETLLRKVRQLLDAVYSASEHKML